MTLERIARGVWAGLHSAKPRGRISRDHTSCLFASPLGSIKMAE